MLSKEEVKERHRIASKRWSDNNKDKIRAYRKSHKEYFRKAQAEYSKRHPDRIIKKNTRYNEEHPNRFKEYYQDNKEGMIKKQVKYQKKKYKEDEDFRRILRLRRMTAQLSGSLEGKSCINCNSIENLQRHHPSYDSYDCVILCRKCHQDLHNFLKGQKEYRKNLSFREVKE